MGATSRRTVVVEGPLAFEMRRLTAARASECGLQIVTLPLLAARLAGGFSHPITAELLEPAIQCALDEGHFAELDRVRALPGITRAVARSLRRAWDADIDVSEIAKRDGAPRLTDLARIDRGVRQRLPPAALLPQDIRNIALEHAGHAPVLLGPVTLQRLAWVAPLWRPLMNRLCSVVPVSWEAPGAADTSWFSGSVVPADGREISITPELISCTDPHHEVVEALRWVRQLISSGRARPSEIALAAAATEEWDEHFLALAPEAGLRIHFSHGIPALSTRDGQRCAALADILLRGLGESRVRRLVTLCTDTRAALDQLPKGWLAALPRGATLHSLADWQRALKGLTLEGEAIDAEAVLLPLLGVLAKGPIAAREVAASLLRGRSREIWDTATRAAPPHAIELSLQNMRLPAETDAGDSVVWAPASHVATAPRPWLRLLGLTSRAWPRRVSEDPILPHHIVSAELFDPNPTPEADRRTFAVLLASASTGVVLSRSRRSAHGHRLGPSPLLPQGQTERVLSRARIPEHAFSEVDRLMARPQEAVATPRIRSATQCWRDWHRTNLTVHDGQFGSDHPVVRQALTRTQSATSLRLLLRSPLGFVWRYALGWRAPEEVERPLTISSEDFGKLVHEVLRRAVDALEPGLGFAAASADEIEAAVMAAAETIRETWPLERAVPPRVLWVNTVAHGATMAIEAFKLDAATQGDTKSWTEVPFGDPACDGAVRDLPWDPAIPVAIPDTEVRIQGAIDRLDLRSAHAAVRVTDYKTGQRPRQPERVVIGGGAELQRSLYGLACRQLLPNCERIYARLVYLADPPQAYPLDDLNAALEQISAFVGLACEKLERGVALPGRDAEAEANDLRLAMPASPAYWRRKGPAFTQAAGRLSFFWEAR
jgi:PD-(D/E)XK nuclease superfamily